jgi:hypothetical protein
VGEEVLPADIFNAIGIDKGGEKLSETREQLKDRYAMRALSIRPELNEKC